MELTDEEVELTHRLVDLEAARTDLVRAADRSVRMLRDAEDALRNGREHVTEEFMERVIDDLRGALDRQPHRD